MTDTQESEQVACPRCGSKSKGKGGLLGILGLVKKMGWAACGTCAEVWDPKDGTSKWMVPYAIVGTPVLGLIAYIVIRAIL